MARQVHTPVAAVTYGTPDTPAGLTADVAEKEQVTLTDDMLLIAFNVDASAHTVTITSVDDKYGRSEDISDVSLASGDFMVWRSKKHGFMQLDGTLHFEANSSMIKFLIVRL